MISKNKAVGVHASVSFTIDEVPSPLAPVRCSFRPTAARAARGECAPIRRPALLFLVISFILIRDEIYPDNVRARPTKCMLNHVCTQTLQAAARELIEEHNVKTRRILSAAAMLLNYTTKKTKYISYGNCKSDQNDIWTASSRIP
ncbi:hypothetical protein EVAR_4748_1 [Eumeta japonica]|uniref:Uncharacterized protein n=1 Tax=Eumeta variegata TaxID=151549 RepID=A0A4C1SZQ5_EUMVA|nr:hypothetical protein EVAR_4748_1 [Eumeta japonica]